MKQQKPSQIRKVTYVLLLIGLLLSLCGGLLGQIRAVILLGIAVMFVGILHHAIRYRCPHCRKYLHRSTGVFCPYCGASVEEET